MSSVSRRIRRASFTTPIAAVVLNLMFLPAPATASTNSAAPAASFTAQGLSHEQKIALFNAFGDALANVDSQALARVVTPGFTWTIPGTSSISGRIHGVPPAMERARRFKQFELKVTVVSFSSIGDDLQVNLHDTGDHHGKHLDISTEDRIAFSGGRIRTVENIQTREEQVAIKDYFG